MLDFMVWLENFRTPFLNKVFELITLMGEETFILVVMCIVFWTINKKAGYKLGFSIIINSNFNLIFKEIFSVARPFTIDKRLTPLRVHSTNDTFSFPSGHTQSSSALFTSLAISMKKRWFTIIAVVFMLLIGYSRIYLSLHTPIDVIGGFIFAIIITYFCHYIIDICSKRNIFYPIILLNIPIIISMIFIQTESFYKVAGLGISFIIGYIIESKYINFTVKTTLLKQFIKSILGLAIALGLKIVLKSLFPDEILFHFLRYFLLGSSVIMLSPYLFKTLKLA